MLVPAETWVVCDEDGEVLGRVKSPFYSSVIYFSETLWPYVQIAVWRWQDVSRHQQAQASELPLLDTDTDAHLIEWTRTLQQKFERTQGSVR